MKTLRSQWSLCLWRFCVVKSFLALCLMLKGETSSSQDSAILSIRPRDGGASISYNGTLQSAESVVGPWENVASGANPFEIDTVDLHRFYRSIESGGLFTNESVLEMVLKGPFQQYFDLAFAGIPDGIFPPVREKPYFDGVLEIGELTLPVRLRVRGNSSLQECPFPKLKLKISRSNREGTLFEEARELKIGTHCAEGGRGNIGRLREEIATYREVLVYEVMEGLGFVGPRIRRVQINYQDASPGELEGRFGWQVSRMAFLMEHVELVAERLGGIALEDEEVAALVDAGFDEQLIVDLMLFHALIGNWDYVLSSDGRGLWNTEVVRLADGTLIPVAGDFDLASWVTGRVRVTAPRNYLPDETDLVRQIQFEFERIRELFGSSQFKRSLERFLQARKGIEDRICAANVDDEGRSAVLEHVGHFYETLVKMAEQDER